VVSLYVYYTYKERAMRKKLTITIAEDVYEGLRRVVGPRHISSFLESLARPHVVASDLDEAYRAMAADECREAEALAWAEAAACDIPDFEGEARETG
jgi:hypothetical protein